MNAMSLLTLGNHKTNKRVWIANQNILGANFRVGDRINILYKAATRTIEVCKSLAGSKVISGRSDSQPIIDIKNATVAETLGHDTDKLEIRFYQNKIVITVSKKSLQKEVRQSKDGKNMFEIFSGGGSLHNFFKNAGYTSQGGLEIDPRFMAVFDENHRNETSLSIQAPIEDVCPSDYPKNIDLLIAGIPCSTFTSSNVKLMRELKALRDTGAADPEELAKRDTGEALVYHVLRAIEYMNPSQIVIEEVEEFSYSVGAVMLRTVLKQMGYHLSETVAQALNTKRKRWCLVADMNSKIDLTDLPTDNGLSIRDVIGEESLQSKDWKTIEESKRFSLASRTIGLRDHEVTESKSNTFTTHGTRSTEPCLKKPNENLYAEFSNEDIAKIHGLDGFILPEGKTLARQVLGQGVADMFKEIAERVMSGKQSTPAVKSGYQSNEPQLSLFA